MCGTIQVNVGRAGTPSAGDGRRSVSSPAGDSANELLTAAQRKAIWIACIVDLCEAPHLLLGHFVFPGRTASKKGKKAIAVAVVLQAYSSASKTAHFTTEYDFATPQHAQCSHPTESAGEQPVQPHSTVPHQSLMHKHVTYIHTLSVSVCVNRDTDTVANHSTQSDKELQARQGLQQFVSCRADCCQTQPRVVNHQ